MLICNKNGYIYKVAGINEKNQTIEVWYLSGAIVDQTFNPASTNAQSGVAIQGLVTTLNSVIQDLSNRVAELEKQIK